MAEESAEAEAEIQDEFVDISIEQDGSLLKKILKHSSDANGKKPVRGDDILIHYDGKLHEDGTKFDSSLDRGMKQYQFQMGYGASDGSTKFPVPRAFDVGVATMNKNEKCILLAKPNYGYGRRGAGPYRASGKGTKVPPNATLEYEVELFAWQEHTWEPDEMESNAERSSHALKHKEEGNEHIKAKEWANALKKYAVGINFMEFNGGARVPSSDDANKKAGAPQALRLGDIGDGAKLDAEDKKLYVALLNNSAMALLKLNSEKNLSNSAAVITLCDKALAVEPSNIKVRYRRGQAHVELGEWALVIEIADGILELDSANVDAQKMRQEAVLKLDASKKNQKAVYGKMFGGK